MEGNPYESPRTSPEPAVPSAVPIDENVRKVAFPPHDAIFPRCCVSCGAPQQTTITVECTSGIDLLFLKVWRHRDFRLPVCYSCKVQRTAAGVASFFICVAAMFAAPVAGYAAGNVLAATWPLVLGLAGGLAAIYFFRNWASPLLDAWLLGVRGLSVTETGVATLRFKDVGYATEAQLTYTRRQKRRILLREKPCVAPPPPIMGRNAA